MGSAITGRPRAARTSSCSRSSRRSTAEAARSRAWTMPRCSAATSGTTRLAASVGVLARTSATRSSSGVSDSWPIALTSGVRQAAAARSSVSLLNARRSSSDPPPRATTMTSTSATRTSDWIAIVTSSTARGPCTGTWRMSNRTAGQRLRAFSTTSRSAALARPQTRPTTVGRNGSAFLRPASNNPSAASSRRRCSSRASSSPTPTGRMSSAASRSEPRLGLSSGRTWTTTRAPSPSGVCAASSTRVLTVAVKERSTSVSRRVRKHTDMPGRRLRSTTWASIHTDGVLET